MLQFFVINIHAAISRLFTSSNSFLLTALVFGQSRQWQAWEGSGGGRGMPDHLEARELPPGVPLGQGGGAGGLPSSAGGPSSPASRQPVIPLPPHTHTHTLATWCDGTTCSA